MSDEAAFLAALRADPHDETVRLVFADWLDERGRRGGELIRAESALATAPLDSPQWQVTFARYQRAGVGLSATWCATVGRHPLAHWRAVAAHSAWARLERWCREHHPRLLEALAPGATAAEVETVERAIGRTLPPDVRASLAIHNGDAGDPGLIFGLDLLRAGQIISDWQMWQSIEWDNDEYREQHSSFPELAVALDYTNPGWVPLTRAVTSSNYIGVDLAPGPAGTIGQVIIFGRDEDHKCVLASGWAEFLADYATFLESGAIAEFDTHLEVWSDVSRAALGGNHPHDRLREWRREGRWPLMPPE